MVPFAPYLPDLAAVNTNASFQAVNVTPSSTGFLPVAALVTNTTALTARAQGAISVRGLTGVIHNFCGDATKLYHLSADGLTWNDVSRLAGGAYSTPSDGWWDFSLFGDMVFCTNGVDAVQVFQIDVAANFTALAGTAPVSFFAGNIRDFAVLARDNAHWNRIRWSAINNVASWVSSTATMSDFQDFPDGGTIMGFVGGEYGLVFLERSIYRMAFEGPPTIFRFDRIANTLGCRIERSIAVYQDLAFFYSNDGFYMIQGGSQIVPIGTEKVDRTIATLLNASLPYRCSSAIDPVRKLYIFGFPSTNSSAAIDTMLVYHWPTGEWSTISATVELIYTAAAQTSYTLDGLDAISTSIETLPFSLDSRVYAGLGNLLLTGFDTSHKQGFFAGSNLAATIETGDVQLTTGRKSLLRNVRPMVEGTSVTPSVTIKSRDRIVDSYATSAASAMNALGSCPVRVNARYHRVNLTIPAASTWKFAQGIDDIDFVATGMR